MKTLLLLLLAFACLLLTGCKPKPAVATATQNSYDLVQRISTLEQRVSTLEDNHRGWVAIDPDSQSYEKLWTPFGALLISTKSVTPYLDGYKVKVAIGNPYNVTFIGFKLSYWCVPRTFTFEEAKQGFDPSKPFKILPKIQDAKTDKFTPPPLSSKKTVSSLLGPPPGLPDFAGLRPVNTQDRTETLYPGSWNEIEFTVAPATADDIRHLRMSIDLNEVRLSDSTFN